MKKLLILFIFLTLNIVSFGQINKNHNNKYNELGYLYIFKLPNGKTIQTKNIIINPSQVDAMEIISRVETARRYGTITKAGSIIIKLKKNVKLILLNQLFSQFNISDDDSTLPIYIDGEEVNEPETILTTEDAISSIKVENKLIQSSIINIVTLGSKTGDSNLNLAKNYYFNKIEVAAVESLISGEKR